MRPSGRPDPHTILGGGNLDDRSVDNGSGLHSTAVNRTKYVLVDAYTPGNTGPAEGRTFGLADGGSIKRREDSLGP